jgi:hypothetical protein
MTDDVDTPRESRLVAFVSLVLSVLVVLICLPVIALAALVSGGGTNYNGPPPKRQRSLRYPHDYRPTSPPPPPKKW